MSATPRTARRDAAPAPSFGAAALAELDKLRTLPPAVTTALAAPLVGALVGAGLAASAAQEDVPVGPLDVALRVVPFVVALLVVLGVAPVAHEHAGRQVLTSLCAVPRRARLAAAKTLAATATTALVSVATVAASAAAAHVVQLAVEAPPAPASPDVTRVLGATAYLTYVGLLAHAVALLVRHGVPALVAVLTLVLVVSPVVAASSDLARWLPDRAATTWYDPGPALLGAPEGTVVALGWLALVGGAGYVRLARTDA